MNVLRFLRTLLSRREWVYLLSLLIPFVLYNLALKAHIVALRPGEHGIARTLELMRSDIFFNLGYALLWIGLFAAVRGRGTLPRRTVIVLFHAVTLLVGIVRTCAYWYFLFVGTTLDYGTIALWLPRLNEILPILFQGGVLLLAWMLLLTGLFYAIWGPSIVTRTVERWLGGIRRPLSAGTAVTSYWGFLGVFVLALGFVFLSSQVGPGSTDTSKSLRRDLFLNVVMTGVKEATAKENSPEAGAADSVSMAADAGLARTPQTEKRNVVLVHLESTRAQSMTPYNQDLKTMPFLNELAKNSLLVEQSYVVVPASSRGTFTVNCGVDPPLYQKGPAFYQAPEFESGGVPIPCLAHLLKERGYGTVFFQSSSASMDNFDAVAKNLGYEEYYPLETMDTEGFEEVYYSGYEDDIMLGPSEEWLRESGNEPFLAEYLTSAGHDDYRCVGTHYGSENFSEDDLLNRYLNCLRLQDIFLENLIEQYKELGLYEETIFVFFGDHGQNLGEHGLFKHGDSPYEEGLKVPLIIHDPKRFQNGEQRVKGLSSQIDILPTVVEMLGYEVEGGKYPGYSLLREPPEDRTLMFSCLYSRKCLASIKGNEKYIHYYDDRPDEFFDLLEDPLEERNLAGERSEEELDRRREEVLAWRSRVNAAYGG